METNKIGDYEITPNSKTVDDLYYCENCGRVYIKKVNCSCNTSNKSEEKK